MFEQSEKKYNCKENAQKQIFSVKDYHYTFSYDLSITAKS